jgi:Trypsin-co-occurring domain 2
MARSDDNPAWVGLAEALAALREDLENAWAQGQSASGKPGVRFKIDPIDLTIQIGATYDTKGAAGVKWHILALGVDHSHERTSMQTLTMRLSPVLVDELGTPMPKTKQLVTDEDE